MRKILILIALMAMAGVARADFSADSVNTGATTDDGWVRDGATFANNSAGIYFGSVSGDSSSIFLRFNLPTIAHGNTVSAAYLLFYSKDYNSGTATGRISANAANNPNAPTSFAEFQALVSTTHYVDWTLSATLSDGQLDSVEITSVVQEIIDSTWWGAGEAIIIMIKNNASANPRGMADLDDSGAAHSAKIHVTYSTGPAAPVNGTLSQTDSSATSVTISGTITNSADSAVYWYDTNNSFAGATYFGVTATPSSPETKAITGLANGATNPDTFWVWRRLFYNSGTLGDSDSLMTITTYISPTTKRAAYRKVPPS